MWDLKLYQRRICARENVLVTIVFFFYHNVLFLFNFTAMFSSHLKTNISLIRTELLSVNLFNSNELKCLEKVYMHKTCKCLRKNHFAEKPPFRKRIFVFAVLQAVYQGKSLWRQCCKYRLKQTKHVRVQNETINCRSSSFFIELTHSNF